MAAVIVKNENSIFAVIFKTDVQEQEIRNKINVSSFNGLRFDYVTREINIPANCPAINIDQFLEG